MDTFKKYIQNPSVLFLGKVILLYTLANVFVLKSVYLADFNLWLCQNIANGSAFILRILTFDAASNDFYVTLNGNNAVFIGTPCNGFEFFNLFICFVLAFPAKWQHKLCFIPVGILSIHLLNIIRVAGLALNWHFSKGSFDFNHKYTFVLFVYGLLFLLWTLWAKRFALITPIEKEN
jgi:exosortase/archaeosortase family protein